MVINFRLNRETVGFKKDIEKLFDIALLETITEGDNICVGVILVTPQKIRELNRIYRNVDKVTDVLSFPMVDNLDDLEKERDFAFGDVNIGDIYINLDRAKEQALEFGHGLKREFCFLALHGFLHLLGFDHIDKKEEMEMLTLQDMIMELAGIKRE